MLHVFIRCYRLCFSEVLRVLLCYRLCSSEVLPVLLCVTGCAPVKCYLFYYVLQAVLQ